VFPLAVSILLAQAAFAQNTGATNGITSPAIAPTGTGCLPGSTTAVLKGNGSNGCTSATSGTDYAPATSGAANLPLFTNGSGGTTTGTRSGNTTEAATVNGATTSGHVATWDANGNVQDGGAAPSPTETNITPTPLAGTTAGTVQCYQDIVGHRKTTLCYVNGYENSTGTAQTISLSANGGSAFSSIGAVISNTASAPVTLSGSPANTINFPTNMTSPWTGLLVIDGL
jgi:hypothetical protein